MWFWGACLHDFLYFFGIDFCIDFWNIFDGKWCQNGSQKYQPGPQFLHIFYSLFRTSTLGGILVALWLPFGTLLAPFGSLLARFWPQWAHFWYAFGTICLLLAPFCSILMSKIALGGTPQRYAPQRESFRQMAPTWDHFGSIFSQKSQKWHP